MKLVNIFPYVLGAVNAETLAAMQERDRLARDLANIRNVSESWKHEVLTWLSLSRELGLTTFNADNTMNFELQIDELKRIASRNENNSSKKIFATLSSYIKEAKSELQIIVMEHADEDIWVEFDNTELIERWRDNEKLIPVEWIPKTGE